MKAVILAAGEGRRMHPFTLSIPKPLLQLQGKKVIDYVFDALPDEVDEVIVTVRYLAEQIKNYLGDCYKRKKIKYAEGSEKGSAIGLLACKGFLKEGERFFILHGDEPQRRAELLDCLKHQYSWVCSDAGSHPSGIATIAPDGKILEVLEKPEKPKSNWTAMGTILVDTNIFKYSPKPHRASGEYPLSSLVNQFVKDYTVYAVHGLRRPPFQSPEDLGWDMKDFQDC